MTNEPIDQALRSWIHDVTRRPTTELQRAVVRREAYLATVESSPPARYFVRVGRAGDLANLPEVVDSEARLTRILGEQGLAVAPVVGINNELGAALYGWVDGEAAVEDAPASVQQQIVDEYMTFLGALHSLDHAKIGIDWMPEPATPRDCALAHAEAVWDQMGHLTVEPLSTFGIHWLRWHAPQEVERISVLHGDAGIGNFLYSGAHMTGVIDWEWAHLGDPMEDVGSAAMHWGFHPAGQMSNAIAAYERARGVSVDRDKVRYYCAHLYVRSVIALHAIAAYPDPHNPVALNLSYRVINDRLACEALADAMDITLTAPELVDIDDSPSDVNTGNLYEIVAANLDAEIAPAITDPLRKNRAEMASLMVRSLDRVRRHAASRDQIELDEMGELLGHRPATMADGLGALDQMIRERGQHHEADILRYLYRRAARIEHVYAPIVSLFPNRQIADIGSA